jgi:gliding motility-associated-like protein
MNQSGSVWNETKMDLQQPFDFKFNVFLGCSDQGADGIAFILQTSPTSVGRTGSGLGFAGVSPSIGIALDTYQNNDVSFPNNDLNDPSYDHISIQANGQVRHGADLAEPVSASATSLNIEDCMWHVLRITWDPAAKDLKAYFDGVLRVEATVDLVNAIFRGNPSVYWGFSASTGGAVNEQKFCTALNPDFTTNFSNNGTCINTPISFTDQSLSFAPIASYYWEYGDGEKSTAAAPAPHQYSAPGYYKARLAITGLDGCKSDTIEKIITIGSVPAAGFSTTDICFRTAPQIRFTNTNIGTSYQWLIDGTEVSTAEMPDLTNVPAGAYTLERRVNSDFGCGNDAASQPFTVKPVPEVEPKLSMDQCIGVPALYRGVQNDNSTVIQQWGWNFGNGQRANLQDVSHAFARYGAYAVKLWATATNGCASDTISVIVSAHKATADAGRDTIVLNNVPFQLNGIGEGTVRWQPAMGLSRDDILNPTGTITNDQAYELTVTSTKGCIAKDTIRLEVFKGSGVYVPTAFTPNGNGLNEVLRPGYKAIKKLSFFTIYNRWGQVVFTTTDPAKGWDGRHKGKLADTGTFIWMLRAEDVVGQVYNQKGTFVLIR